jgi:hypothetical protein
VSCIPARLSTLTGNLYPGRKVCLLRIAALPRARGYCSCKKVRDFTKRARTGPLGWTKNRTGCATFALSRRQFTDEPARRRMFAHRVGGASIRSILRILRVSVSEDFSSHRSGGRRFRRGEVLGPAATAVRSTRLAHTTTLCSVVRSFAATCDLRREASLRASSIASGFFGNTGRCSGSEFGDCCAATRLGEYDCPRRRNERKDRHGDHAMHPRLWTDRFSANRRLGRPARPPARRSTAAGWH